MTENYTVFIKHLEGIIESNIPSKFSNSPHNLPWTMAEQNLKKTTSLITKSKSEKER